jgi:hypothetical protein
MPAQAFRQGESCPQVTRPHRWERKGPCISTPAATLRTLPATALALRERHSRAVMMAGAVGDLGMESWGQYSSASMTVITRTVTAGSVGSGEW